MALRWRLQDGGGLMVRLIRGACVPSRLSETGLFENRMEVRMRALIVDDSSFIREYLRHLLDRMGIACEEAVDGSDALTVLAA